MAAGVDPDACSAMPQRGLRECADRKVELGPPLWCTIMAVRVKLEKLLLLQRLNEQIATCQKDREALSLDVRRAEQQLHDLEEDLNVLKARLLAAQKAADAHELKISEAEQESKRLETQLNTTRHQREYDAIMAAIASRKADVEKWEDEELALLDAVDDARKGMREDHERIEKQRSALQELTEQVEQQQRKYDQELAELGRKQKALRGTVDGDVLSAYERIAGSRGGQGLAEVRGRVCQGCFTTITKQKENELMRDEEVLYCTSCGRLLMLAE